MPMLKHFGCYDNLSFPYTYNGKLAFISVLLQIFWQKFYRNVPGVVLYKPYEFCPKSLILIGCHGNRNVQFSKKKYKKNLLFRSHKGDEAETLH